MDKLIQFNTTSNIEAGYIFIVYWLFKVCNDNTTCTTTTITNNNEVMLGREWYPTNTVLIYFKTFFFFSLLSGWAGTPCLKSAWAVAHWPTVSDAYAWILIKTTKILN